VHEYAALLTTTVFRLPRYYRVFFFPFPLLVSSRPSQKASPA